MVRTKDDIMNSLREVIGENSDDTVLGLLEDVEDTIGQFDGVEDWKGKYESNNAEWENKYKELDSTWREKYRERFYGNVSDVDTDFAKEQEQTKKVSFEDLFKEV